MNNNRDDEFEGESFQQEYINEEPWHLYIN